MNEQQIGLLIVAPTLLGFIVFMRRRGAVSFGGAVFAALACVVFATGLFLAQW